MVTTRVAARTGRGGLTIVEETLPPPGPGEVLVEVHRSLISPGTELGGGWKALASEREAPRPSDRPLPIGYSNAGVVREVGPGVIRFSAGDRVAAVGAGYARHADYAVVPHNLVAALPDGVGFQEGAFAMLAATALHAVRRTGVSIGEYGAAVGLGLVGQLAARLLQLAGCFVIGWDLLPHRLSVADGWGIDATCNPSAADPVETTRSFTDGQGLDSGIVAIAGEATAAVGQLERSMKLSPDGHRTGVITFVGGIHLDYHGDTTNIDYRRASRTGPGYHDDDWERGADYPPVLVRWSTAANIALCLRFISEGKLDVAPLVTHVVPLADCESEIDRIVDDYEAALGVVFAMR